MRFQLMTFMPQLSANFTKLSCLKESFAAAVPVVVRGCVGVSYAGAITSGRSLAGLFTARETS